MAGDLLVANGDEFDGASSQRRKHCNIRVTAKSEDVLHVSAFEEVDYVLGDRLSFNFHSVHHATS